MVFVIAWYVYGRHVPQTCTYVEPVLVCNLLAAIPICHQLKCSFNAYTNRNRNTVIRSTDKVRRILSSTASNFIIPEASEFFPSKYLQLWTPSWMIFFPTFLIGLRFSCITVYSAQGRVGVKHTVVDLFSDRSWSETTFRSWDWWQSAVKTLLYTRSQLNAQ